MLPEHETLSDQAKGVAGIYFGIGTELTFQCAESKPSPQMQAALSELCRSGLISSKTINKRGGTTYTREMPHEVAQEFWRFAGENLENPALKFPVTVPLEPTLEPEKENG